MSTRHPSSTREIKRYPNRKLYDTHESCFTSLRELERLVKDGWDLQVIEHPTGSDITEDTLAQMLRTSRAQADVLSAMIRSPASVARSVEDTGARAELRSLLEEIRTLSDELGTAAS